jgi:hypothetical protein
MNSLNQEEKELLNSVENNEWNSIKDMEEAKKNIKVMPKNIRKSPSK